MGGIKLQFLCDVRIESTVGSLPYPRQSGAPTAWYKGIQPHLGLINKGRPITVSQIQGLQNQNKQIKNNVK